MSRHQRKQKGSTSPGKETHTDGQKKAIVKPKRRSPWFRGLVLFGLYFMTLGMLYYAIVRYLAISQSLNETDRKIMEDMCRFSVDAFKMGIGALLALLAGLGSGLFRSAG